ncbi:MAG: hypothetical protein RBT41_06340 [Clostridia bacterium]|jgi:hypothetical protein|nr:hypothetical protein [Clostridia bacterium]
MADDNILKKYINIKMIRFMTEEDLRQKVAEHNTKVYPPEFLQKAKEELALRERIREKETKNKWRRALNGLFISFFLILMTLVASNPTEQEYLWYLEEKTAGPVAQYTTTMQNYYLFTFYETDLSGENIRVLGLLKKFFVLEG